MIIYFYQVSSFNRFLPFTLNQASDINKTLEDAFGAC